LTVSKTPRFNVGIIVDIPEMLGMADKGDNTNVDMLVGDIYGAGMNVSD
jgi:pantothenate kinase